MRGQMGLVRGLGAALALLGGCGDDTQMMQPPPTCQAGTVSDEAKIPPGPYPGHAGSYVLIDGRLLTPTGTQVGLGGFPIGVRFVGGGTRFLAVTDGAKGTESIRIVDLQSQTVVATEPYANQKGLFYGLAVSADGRRLYAAGGGEDVVHVLDFDPATAMLTVRPDVVVPQFPAGLALSDDGSKLYVGEQTSGKLAVVDLAQGMVTQEIAVGSGSEALMDVVLAPAATGRNEAYATLWTGAAVAVVDLGTGTVDRIPVGRNPEGLLLLPDGNRAVTAASDDDSVVVVDLVARQVAMTVPVGLEAQNRGSSPNALALSPDGARLYAVLAGENSLVALSTSDFLPIGRLPTAWYPSAVAVAQDGTVVVANSKGLPAGPADGSIEKSDLIAGTLSLIPAPADAALQAGTAQIMSNSARPTTLETKPVCPPGATAFPLPGKAGDPTPIEHVVLIVRENKTYDSELGSLPHANGDPSLEIFGPQMTPNLHALAASFANLDNFYSDAEASLQGHVLTTAAFVNDFGEKTWLQVWGRHWRGDALFGEDIVVSRDFLWQELAAAGISYVDMGEIVGTPDSQIRVNIDTQFPGVFFDLDTADSARASYVAGRIAASDWQLPKFTYMILPRNHTYALDPGRESPQSMIADNDEATGTVVEALSQSPYWPSTVVFIVEDDPQDGGDHVDGHRSICIVASPWVRHGYTSSAIYDVPSLFRTIERLLGMNALYQADARAAAMADLFTNQTDPTPFSHIPRMIPMSNNPMIGPLVEASRKLDFSQPDHAPETARILWEYFRGSPAPWQAASRGPDDDD